MKKSKRQIVTNNIFTNQDQNNQSNQGQCDFYHSIRQNKQTQTIQKEQRKQKQINLNKTLPQQRKRDQSENRTDERKKRLQLLKKKYLKGNKDNLASQTKQQEKLKQEKIAQKSNIHQIVQKQKIKIENKQLIQKKTQIQYVDEQNKFNLNKIQQKNSKTQEKEIVEQKELVQTHNKKITPPSVSTKKRKTIPPPSNHFNKQQNQQNVQIAQKVQIVQKLQQNQNKITNIAVSTKKRRPIPPPPSYFNKQQNVQREEKVQNIQNQKVKQNEQIEHIDIKVVQQNEIPQQKNVKVNNELDKKSDKKLDNMIQFWLGENEDLRKYFYAQKQKKLKFELKKNNIYTLLLKKMIQQFILHNQNTNHQNNSQLIQSILIQQEQLNQTIQQDYVLILLIKGRTILLQKYSKFLINNLSQNINKLAQYKSYLSQQELQIFITFIFQKCQIDLKDVVKLLKLNFNSQAILKKIMSIEKQKDCFELGQILYLLYQNINQKNYHAYFYILGIVINYVDKYDSLQKIINKIGSISIQQAYNLKKQVRAKIIKKMENPKQKNQNQPIKPNQEDPIQKTVGFFKKLINQVSQKQKESNIQQKKQDIYFDKEKGRFVLNGKIPQSDQPQPPKQKIKIPPPPPTTNVGRTKNLPKKRAVIRQTNIDFDDV